MNNEKQTELFPIEMIITGLSCSKIELKNTKDGQRVEMKLSGQTTARVITDLSNDDYLIAAAELLVKLCAGDYTMAKTWIDTIEAKYSLDDLVEFMSGINRPVLSGGTIKMTYSTAIDFMLDCIIVEKPTIIKLIAKWVIMLSKGDFDKCYRAINDGYLRIANRDNIIPLNRAA